MPEPVERWIDPARISAAASPEALARLEKESGRREAYSREYRYEYFRDYQRKRRARQKAESAG
jgi:hypothetical protein